MNPKDARQFIVDHVAVHRSDVIDAKAFLAELTGDINVAEVAQDRANKLIGSPEAEMPLWQSDPTAALLLKAQHISARLALFQAAWELLHNGVLFMGQGDIKVETPYLSWTTVRPGGGGSRSGEPAAELRHSYPTLLIRPTWIKDGTTLTDADLYLRALDASAVHAGIAEALKQAVRAFAIGLFVPAVAMLDAASEGAWIEAGKALAIRPPTDNAGSRLTATLDDPRVSMRTKSAAVCEYYDKRKDAQSEAAIQPALLRDTQQWSGLVRDARNVLHWNVTASVPNDYSKVSTLLLAALSHIKRLHLVATA